MQPFDSIDRLERAAVLDKVAGPVRSLLQKALPSQRIRDLLHGVWLGHPAHPMLVQLPIGSWVSAGFLDCAFVAPGPATFLTGLGVVAAVPSAAAGLADWAELHPEQQRVGVVHAGANVLALAFEVASLVDRLGGRRTRGQFLGLAGTVALAAGGVLGGHLSFRQAAGANHVEDIPHLLSPDWQHVATVDDLPDGEMVSRQLGQVPVLLLRRGDRVHAVADRCSHLSAPLHEGELREGTQPCVVCPWHGSTFRLLDGSVVHGPATAPLPVFLTRVVAGAVEVRLPGAG